MEKIKGQPTKDGSKKDAGFELNFNVNIHGVEGKDFPKAVAYVFDSQNRLVGQKPLERTPSQKVKFNLSGEMKNDKIKVIVGPHVGLAAPEEKKCLAEKLPHGARPMRKPTPNMLLGKGGVGKNIRLREDFIEKEIVVQREDIRKWGDCTCTVRGRLVKQFKLPDGNIKVMGVSHACVYIWEVDGLYYVLEKLPEYELIKLRDELLEIVEQWPPKPWPPGPEPGPWPPGPDPVPLMYSEAVFPFKSDLPAGVEPKEASAPKTPAAKEELGAIFMAQSAVSLRTEMLLQAENLIKYICYSPSIYHHLNKEFLTCSCTDSYGYFETVITYPCFGDKPDLYFTAYQCIDSNWVTLYDPGMRCHVYWNYDCGSEVQLVTHEPGARVCVDDRINPPPGIFSWVEPHGIGGLNLSQINDEGRVELYEHKIKNQTIEITNAPFGSTIGFTMGHSRNIPNDDVRYYRLQYRKGVTGAWHEFTIPVTRHYIHEKNNKVSFPTVQLGPVPNPSDGSMLVYWFKPAKPSDLDSSLNDAFDQWPDDNWFSSDIYSGYLDTHNLPGGVDDAHGLYQIKIEVYDSGGHIVDPDIVNPKFTFIKPTSADSKEAATDTDVAPGKNRDDEGFIFNVAIDNRECHASIDLPVVGGEVIDESDPEGFVCGMLTYQSGDNVNIAFRASQEGNNALATFTLKRGAETLGEKSMSWVEVASALSTGPYLNDPDGNFHQSFGAGDLLGPCANAAFTEHLYVYAKATNGWHRLAGYDASAFRAFSLVSEDSETGGDS